ncbi:hypothetical protein Bbelb_129180 [Branchiostoma belcheri]|nr:hypothetical protein Bbelb_129180 [Branchiostoma belcheri]
MDHSKPISRVEIGPAKREEMHADGQTAAIDLRTRNHEWSRRKRRAIERPQGDGATTFVINDFGSTQGTGVDTGDPLRLSLKSFPHTRRIKTDVQTRTDGRRGLEHLRTRDLFTSSSRNHQLIIHPGMFV